MLSSILIYKIIVQVWEVHPDPFQPVWEGVRGGYGGVLVGEIANNLPGAKRALLPHLLQHDVRRRAQFEEGLLSFQQCARLPFRQSGQDHC